MKRNIVDKVFDELFEDHLMMRRKRAHRDGWKTKIDAATLYLDRK